MQIYLVGGAVRDKLLNLPVTEKDWVVVGSSPEEMLKLGYKPVGKDFPVFLHPTTHEEYALARTERKSGKRHGDFIFNSSPDVSLEQDLQRRDLSINAMAEDQNGHIIDPYGGQADIKNKMLRHVSDAFKEDPLRVLRLARFMAKFAPIGFKIAPETLKLIQEMVAQAELEHLSEERIWQETYKALISKEPEAFFTVLQDCDALRLFFPGMTNRGLSALRQATALSSVPVIRFAAACFEHSVNLKLPSDYSALQKMTMENHELVSKAHELNPETLLSLFKKTDALRRPERFGQLLLACQAVHPEANNTSLLEHRLECLLKLSFQDLSTQYQGKELANKIDERRLDSLRHYKM
ncbi:MAG: cca [Gammaproteobacteria bacterium]|jgi:tRNA nucleotidyltransferase (CCA-adding enzyme)|nr:cca [Gammaproteobacteria bacterium]